MWLAGMTGTGENQSNIHVIIQKAGDASGSQAAPDKNTASEAGSDSNGDNMTVSGVSLKISDEGKQKLEAQKNFLESLQSQWESIESQQDSEEESWDVYGKCLKIAMSIVSGDNVPQQDIQYLMEHNMDLYTQAMSMRIPKEDPEDCDSVLEEEEEGGEEDATSGASVVESGMLSVSAAESTVEVSTK